MSSILGREHRPAERIADNVVHVVGIVSGLAACIVLAILALPSAGARMLAGVGLYSGGLTAMLWCSALYNMARDGAWKRILRRCDHAAIFVMIAGTYTPFALEVIGGAWGWSILVFVWVVAFGGMALKLFLPHRFERLSIVVYLLMGWCIIVAVEPLLAGISMPGLVLLVTGGALYSLGVVFHLWSRLPFQNAIWHGLVLAAAGCHYAAILRELIFNA